MTGPLLRRYLSDRLALIAAFYAAAGLILLLFSLLLGYEGVSGALVWRNAGYGLVLTTLVAGLYCTYDLMRWWPFARQMARLMSGKPDLTALANLPAGATAEQEAFRDVLGALYSQSMAELARLQGEHDRHLAFINQWVHNMKTPVAGLGLVAQQAADLGPKAVAAALDEEATRLNDGLELVLTMARLQDFARDYHIRRADLLQALRDTINARKQQFIRYGIFPAVEAEPGQDWTVLTDAKWNGFVLDQIIANALKYSRQAGPAGQRLTCRLHQEGGHVVLTIADQGPGIPPEDLPRVFEPFFTGENGRRFGGATGIGLYLVRRIVDELEHEVAMESAPGAGTTVRLTYLAKT